MTVWLAYRASRQYGGALEDTTRIVECLLDADCNQFELIKRANAHFALPETIRSERGNKLEIKPFRLESEVVHGGGGGCFYDAKLVIRPAPTLTNPKKEKQ